MSGFPKYQVGQCSYVAVESVGAFLQQCPWVRLKQAWLDRVHFYIEREEFSVGGCVLIIGDNHPRSSLRAYPSHSGMQAPRPFRLLQAPICGTLVKWANLTLWLLTISPYWSLLSALMTPAHIASLPMSLQQFVFPLETRVDCPPGVQAVRSFRHRHLLFKTLPSQA